MSTTTSSGPATGSGASPYCSISGPPWPVSNTAFIDASFPIWSSRRRDRETAGDAVPLDEARDDPGPLCLLDKIVQEGKPYGVLLRRADRLLNRGELPV